MTVFVPGAIVVLGQSGGRQVMTTNPSVDPSAGGGVAAPIGSLYLRDTGTLYTKTGAGATAWTVVGDGAAAVLVWGNDSVAASADTRFLYPGRSTAIAPLTTITGYRSPRAGTLRRFRVRHNSAIGNGNSVVYDVLINSVAQGLGLTLASGAVGDASDEIASFAVAANDLIEVTATKALSIGAGGLNVQFACELGV